MSTLYASAARRSITPSNELRALWNKSARKPYSIPLNDIYVQAMVFSDQAGQVLVHVGGDLIMTYGPQLRDQICKELNTKPSCVFFSCTHNHMIPDLSSSDAGGGGGGFGVGEGAKEWTEFVYAQAIAAVREAIATLRPARIGAGHGVSGISVNREWDTPVGSLGTGDRNGNTLHEISVLRVDEVGGKPIAVMVNSNCHAGSFYGGNLGLDHRLVGGDVAGLVSEFVGNAIGNGVVPIWAIGGAGDQNTYFHSGMMWPSVDDKGEFFLETYVMKDDDAIKLARNTAAIQCMEVLNVYKNITQFSEHFELKTGITYKVVTRQRQTRPGLAPGAAPGGPPGAAPGGTPPPGAARPPAPIEYEQATLRFYLIALNGIAFAGANSESFIGLKKAVRGILPYDEKFWIDMNFDEKSGFAGYVPTPRYDSNYDQGKRHNLQGALMPYNGNDVLRLYCDGIDELVKTIS
jgi:hypothetical protein